MVACASEPFVNVDTCAAKSGDQVVSVTEQHRHTHAFAGAPDVVR